MFWQGVQGVDIISDLKKETDLWSGLNIGFLNKGKRVLDAWSPANPGSDNSGTWHVTTVTNEKRVSTYYVENGSFLKLRNLQCRLQRTESMDRENQHGVPALLPQCTKSAHYQEQRFHRSRPGKRELRLSYSFEHHFWRERQLFNTTNNK